MADRTMGREELERWYVEHGVARWGEGERAGLEQRARRKSLAALAADHDMATGMSSEDIMARADAREDEDRVTRYQAVCCLEDGPT